MDVFLIDCHGDDSVIEIRNNKEVADKEKNDGKVSTIKVRYFLL